MITANTHLLSLRAPLRNLMRFPIKPGMTTVYERFLDTP